MKRISERALTIIRCSVVAPPHHYHRGVCARRRRNGLLVYLSRELEAIEMRARDRGTEKRGGSKGPLGASDSPDDTGEPDEIGPMNYSSPFTMFICCRLLCV